VKIEEVIEPMAVGFETSRTNIYINSPHDLILSALFYTFNFWQKPLRRSIFRFLILLTWFAFKDVRETALLSLVLFAYAEMGSAH